MSSRTPRMSPPPLPPALLPIGIVGIGRAGALFARALAHVGMPVHVWTRHPEHLPADLAELSERDLGALARRSRTVIIAVTDRAIVEVAAAMRAVVEDDTPRAWVHLSGALGAGILSPVVPPGDTIAAMHPLQTIAPDADPAILQGALAALDAPDDAGLTLASRLARLLGMHPVPVPAVVRPGYHAAGALASGGLATVLVTARDILRESGLPDREVREGLRTIATTALEAALADDPDQGWTGPLVRGDTSTLRAQLEALDRFPPEVSDLFRALMRTLLARLDRHPTLSATPRDAVRAMLTESRR